MFALQFVMEFFEFFRKGAAPKRPDGKVKKIYQNILIYFTLHWTFFKFFSLLGSKSIQYSSNGTCICIYYDYNFISRSEAICIERLLEKYYVDSFIPLLAKNNVYFFKYLINRVDELSQNTITCESLMINMALLKSKGKMMQVERDDYLWVFTKGGPN